MLLWVAFWRAADKINPLNHEFEGLYDDKAWQDGRAEWLSALGEGLVRSGGEWSDGFDRTPKSMYNQRFSRVAWVFSA
jgi:hypothetical protein